MLKKLNTIGNALASMCLAVSIAAAVAVPVSLIEVTAAHAAQPANEINWSWTDKASNRDDWFVVDTAHGECAPISRDALHAMDAMLTLGGARETHGVAASGQPFVLLMPSKTGPLIHILATRDFCEYVLKKTVE